MARTPREQQRVRMIGYPIAAAVAVIAAALAYGTCREHGEGPWTAGLVAFVALFLGAVCAMLLIELD
jgi:hypothetical protein